MQQAKPALAMISMLAATCLGFHPTGQEEMNPTMAWGIRHLLNYVFILEYVSIKESSSPDQKRLTTRAAFAAANAKAIGQVVPQIEKSAEPPNLNDLDKTFSDERFQAWWLQLRRSYQARTPRCAMTVDEVRNFADHHLKLSSGSRTANPLELLAPIRHWPAPKVQCLIFALQGTDETAKREKGFDPIFSLRAMQQLGWTNMRAPSMQLALTLRLLQLGQYAEVLRILVDMQDDFPAFRLPYEIVQRIYSRTHSGQGAVALQGF